MISGRRILHVPDIVVACLTTATLGAGLLLGAVANAAAQSGEPRPVPMVERTATGSRELQIATVSARNDMASGGDVLVRVTAAGGIDRIAVTLNGQPVTNAFRPVPGTNALLGLVTGMRAGDNTLEVSRQGARSSLVITNWPIEGPIFSGPHEDPYVCMTHLFKLPVTGGDLGQALDKHCSIRTRVDYVYRTTNNEFKPLPDPTARPADLARTKTNADRDVAYVVRVETGTVNRAIYQIAVLHDPTTDAAVDPWSRSAGWNGRLVYTFGGGCPGGWYQQGRTTGGVLDDAMLSQGFAVASSSKNVFGNNCDDLLAAETVMMVKERFIERFGRPQHTIGWGCSGGSDQVHQIGDNYPGLLDGIVPACSFPDIPWAHTTTHSFGARMLFNYFRTTSGVKWTKEQQVAVVGFPSYETLVQQATRPDRVNPRGACDQTIPVDRLYDPAKNPRGARCTTYDHGVAVWGTDPATGFARRPLDNRGVQYGLKTLNAGIITKAQFLDLNEKIGGIDIDANITTTRSVGDSIAVRRGYESGRFLSGGGGLAGTPIIDYRAYADFQPGDPHMRVHGFSTRHRLIEANGHADNHVMLVEDYTYGGFSTRSPLVREALRQMDQWLLNLARDTSAAPRPAKVVKAKPADLRDVCLTPNGKRIAETQLYQAGACNLYFPSHATAFIVAGMPVANNIVVCQKKPVDPGDYAVPMSEDELARLRRIFPDGVCDYGKPGIGQRGLLGTWLSFGPAGQASARTTQD
jgi:hypothetical protein